MKSFIKLNSKENSKWEEKRTDGTYRKKKQKSGRFILITIILKCNGLLLFSSSVMSDSLQPHGLQHTRLPCPPPSPGVYSNSCPLSRWRHPTISFSVIPSTPDFNLPASGSFPMSLFFISGGRSIRTSTSTSVLPMNIQDWFPLGWTGWICL